MSEENVEVKSKALVWLSAIPAVLGIGALVWLTGFRNLHDFNHQTSQEKRASVAVQALPLPKEPLKIEIYNSKRLCHQIESAEFDGDELVMYIRNVCGNSIRAMTEAAYVETHWQALAPDGTVIATGWNNHLYENDLAAGQRTEIRQRYGVSTDARIVKWIVRLRK